MGTNSVNSSKNIVNNNGYELLHFDGESRVQAKLYMKTYSPTYFFKEIQGILRITTLINAIKTQVESFQTTYSLFNAISPLKCRIY